MDTFQLSGICFAVKYYVPLTFSWRVSFSTISIVRIIYKMKELSHFQNWCFSADQLHLEWMQKCGRVVLQEELLHSPQIHNPMDKHFSWNGWSDSFSLFLLWLRDKFFVFKNITLEKRSSVIDFSCNRTMQKSPWAYDLWKFFFKVKCIACKCFTVAEICATILARGKKKWEFQRWLWKIMWEWYMYRGTWKLFS